MSSEVIQINLFLLSGDGGWTGLWIGLDQSDILYNLNAWVRGAASYLSRSRTLQYYLNLYGLDSPKEQYFTIKDPPSLGLVSWTRPLPSPALTLPRAGDAIHPVLGKGAVWSTRLHLDQEHRRLP